MGGPRALVVAHEREHGAAQCFRPATAPDLRISAKVRLVSIVAA